ELLLSRSAVDSLAGTGRSTIGESANNSTYELGCPRTIFRLESLAGRCSWGGRFVARASGGLAGIESCDLSASLETQETGRTKSSSRSLDQAVLFRALCLGP